MTAERQWIFPMDSKADVIMPDIGHRYWSTHCRHGNHADCKGSCKICASPCVCAGCTHQPVEGDAATRSGLRPLPIMTAPADEPVSVPPPARVEVEVRLLQILYDMVVGSLDWGSGFFDGEEVDAVEHVARLLGIKDSKPPNEREPHLWHQDCALPWRCGQSAGAEIHRVEMPHA